jgi:hypothetical protein
MLLLALILIQCVSVPTQLQETGEDLSKTITPFSVVPTKTELPTKTFPQIPTTPQMVTITITKTPGLDSLRLTNEQKTTLFSFPTLEPGNTYPITPIQDDFWALGSLATGRYPIWISSSGEMKFSRLGPRVLPLQTLSSNLR